MSGPTISFEINHLNGGEWEVYFFVAPNSWDPIPLLAPGEADTSQFMEILSGVVIHMFAFW